MSLEVIYWNSVWKEKTGSIDHNDFEEVSSGLDANIDIPELLTLS